LKTTLEYMHASVFIKLLVTEPGRIESHATNSAYHDVPAGNLRGMLRSSISGRPFIGNESSFLKKGISISTLKQIQEEIPDGTQSRCQ